MLAAFSGADPTPWITTVAWFASESALRPVCRKRFGDELTDGYPRWRVALGCWTQLICIPMLFFAFVFARQVRVRLSELPSTAQYCETLLRCFPLQLRAASARHATAGMDHGVLPAGIRRQPAPGRASLPDHHGHDAHPAPCSLPCRDGRGPSRARAGLAPPIPLLLLRVHRARDRQRHVQLVLAPIAQSAAAVPAQAAKGKPPYLASPAIGSRCAKGRPSHMWMVPDGGCRVLHAPST